MSASTLKYAFTDKGAPTVAQTQVFVFSCCALKDALSPETLKMAYQRWGATTGRKHSSTLVVFPDLVRLFKLKYFAEHTGVSVVEEEMPTFDAQEATFFDNPAKQHRIPLPPSDWTPKMNADAVTQYKFVQDSWGNVTDSALVFAGATYHESDIRRAKGQEVAKRPTSAGLRGSCRWMRCCTGCRTGSGLASSTCESTPSSSNQNPNPNPTFPSNPNTVCT